MLPLPTVALDSTPPFSFTSATSTLPPPTITPSGMLLSSPLALAAFDALPHLGFFSATRSLPITMTTPPSLGLSSLAPVPPITNIVTVKLSHDNNPLWLWLASPYLFTYDLMPYVDGSVRQSSTELVLPNGMRISNPELQSWLKTNHAIRANLLATMTSEMMFKVYDILPTYEIWSTLQ
ncbi:hypothetical protein MLD38_009621 [Melastoma candidum]|uniref:Uncharacterized protein n=1 Tax=Melastoma candidum TaxID=119954 RepID=A0ACB9RYP9_9MYRT|nr:hypothetical protein MLD38_009621 [Melastoma candidum]